MPYYKSRLYLINFRLTISTYQTGSTTTIHRIAITERIYQNQLKKKWLLQQRPQPRDQDHCLIFSLKREKL